MAGPQNSKVDIRVASPKWVQGSSGRADTLFARLMLNNLKTFPPPSRWLDSTHNSAQIIVAMNTILELTINLSSGYKLSCYD
jgi:hypothetical protein